MAEARYNSVEVRINGQVFKLRTDVGTEYVQNLAAYVEGVMREVARQGSSPASDRVAIMAALQIADSLFQLQRQMKGKAQVAHDKLNALITASDQLLEE